MTADPRLAARVAEVLGREATSAQLDALRRFASLLADRGATLGVISRADSPIDRLMERHVVDSLRAAAVVRPGDERAYDLGSGGGLPGIVVAIVCPTLTVTCIEARRNRAAFLELAIDSLALENASARLSRIQDVRGPVDLCFARALASPDLSWDLAAPLLGPDGRLVYFAGKGFRPADPAAGATERPDPTPTIELVPAIGLESAGPLVIMGRP